MLKGCSLKKNRYLRKIFLVTAFEFHVKDKSFFSFCYNFQNAVYSGLLEELVFKLSQKKNKHASSRPLFKIIPGRKL